MNISDVVAETIKSWVMSKDIRNSYTHIVGVLYNCSFVVEEANSLRRVGQRLVRRSDEARFIFILN